MTYLNRKALQTSFFCLLLQECQEEVYAIGRRFLFLQHHRRMNLIHLKISLSRKSEKKSQEKEKRRIDDRTNTTEGNSSGMNDGPFPKSKNLLQRLMAELILKESNKTGTKNMALLRNSHLTNGVSLFTLLCKPFPQLIQHLFFFKLNIQPWNTWCRKGILLCNNKKGKKWKGVATVRWK